MHTNEKEKAKGKVTTSLCVGDGAVEAFLMGSEDFFAAERRLTLAVGFNPRWARR
jgi:hypothetical protein